MLKTNTLSETGTSMTNLKTAFDFVVDCMETMATTILGNAIFLLPVGIYVAGAAIGLCGRLIGR